MRFAKAVKIKDLKPWAKNPRKHDKDLESLVRSIEHFGWTNPILVQEKTNRVIAGHGRLEAAKQAGIAAVPVIYLAMKDEDAAAYTVADNKLAELSKWDEEALSALLKELEEDQYDLSLTGFSEEDIERLLAQESQVIDGEDNIPAIPKTAITKKGEGWILGDHLLYCASCTDAETVGQLFNGRKAGLLHTDPPYGVDYSKTKDGIPRSGFSNHQEIWGDIENDDLDGDKLQIFLEQAFRAAVPHLDTAGWYLWHAHLTQGFFAAAAAAAADVLLHRQIIWKKPGFVLTRSGMYHWSHEPCFYGWQRGKQPPWYGDKSQTSVWEVGRDEDHGMHPTQKPVALFEIPIANHLKRGEVCYEPFAGSGTQFIAAEKLERVCIGFEIEPRYCDVIVERWETFTGGAAKRVSL